MPSSAFTQRPTCPTPLPLKPGLILVGVNPGPAQDPCRGERKGRERKRSQMRAFARPPPGGAISTGQPGAVPRGRQGKGWTLAQGSVALRLPPQDLQRPASGSSCPEACREPTVYPQSGTASTIGPGGAEPAPVSEGQGPKFRGSLALGCLPVPSHSRQAAGPHLIRPVLGSRLHRVKGSQCTGERGPGSKQQTVTVPVLAPAGGENRAVLCSQMGKQFMCLMAGVAGWGGQSVTHTGLPIVVSLANRAVSFSCRITYPYTPEFKDFTVHYFHQNLSGQRSPEGQTSCRPGLGTENQTSTLECHVTLRLQSSSATGTYYCSVHWPRLTVNGNGTFILVRDTGYREPPHGPQKALLFGFTGLLTVLSILGTALLLWRKKWMQVPGKQPSKQCPDPRSASGPTQPPAESVYTALQRRETEVYACLESEDGSPHAAPSPPSQEKRCRLEDDSELNLVYENL
ncbi:NFAT activation molecule 1 [Eulemur rufifrons]|uniref:NFAT activation molecule 1 n=1 Tax=Eulemur rufifrons TaxID=859984 RepID=UPI003742DE5D